MTEKAWFKRTFNELPEKTEHQTGVQFVGILFGVAVGTTAVAMADPIVELFRQASPDPHGLPTRYEGIRYISIMHYLVVLTLTVTSFVGYHTSKHLPSLVVKFANLPLVLFFLDVVMVVSYFLAALFAEGPGDEANARPEVWFVAFAFVLYALWDLCNSFIKRHPASQLAMGRSPEPAGWSHYGWRRKTTLTFTVGILAGASVLQWAPFANDQSNTTVAIIDWSIIVVLIVYRLAKFFGDESIEYLGKLEPADSPATPVTVPYGDWKRLVPPAVPANFSLLLDVVDKGSRPLADDEPAAIGRAAAALSAAGAIEISLVDNQSVLKPTKAGTAYVGALDEAERSKLVPAGD